MKLVNKILVWVFLSFFISNGSFAQSINEKNLSKYVGIWEADFGTSKFVLNLVLKDFIFEPTGDEVQQLFGVYSFDNQSQLKGENLKTLDSYYLRNGVYVNERNREYLTFVFVDKELGNVGKLNLYINSDDVDKLEWSLYKTEKINVSNIRDLEKASRFSVPQKLTLKRIGD